MKPTTQEQLNRVLNINLDQKISKYFDGKFNLCNQQGLKEQNKRTKELLQNAKDIKKLNLDQMFLNVWDQYFNIKTETYWDYQIDKIFYHR